MEDPAIRSDVELRLNQPANSSGVDDVLFAQDALCQDLRRVGGLDRHDRLQHDRTVIQRRSHQMYGRPRHLAARINGTSVGVQAWKGRQQRRVNIDHTVAVAADKFGRQNAHESSQHDDIGLEVVDGLRQRGIKGFSGIVGAVIDHGRGNTPCCGRLKAERIRTVADHGGDARRPALTFASERDRVHVRAAARNQNDNVLHAGVECSWPELACGSAGKAWPRTLPPRIRAMNNEVFQTLLVYALPVLLAITLHEAAHGYTARHFGDPTAAQLGRLSLNPMRHIDLMGTIVMPLMLYVATAGMFVFGYAKPVPVDIRQLKHPKRDMIWVAVAGPASNLVQAVLWAVVGTMLLNLGLHERFFLLMARAGVLVNLVMCAFNLFPIPPLDGGRVAVGLLPVRLAQPLARVEPWGFFLVMALVLLGWVSNYWMVPIVGALLGLLATVLPAMAVLMRLS